LILKRLPDDIETQVQELLGTFDGYKVQKHPGESVEWGFQLVGEPEKRGEIKGIMEVYQPKGRTDYVALTQKVELEDSMVDMLGQLSEASLAQLYFELMTETYRSNCDITIGFDLRIPKWFRIGMMIYADALSQDTFVYRVNKIHNTVGLLLAILNRAALNYSKKPIPDQV